EMFGLSDERWHIEGGNQRLPEAIAELLGVGTNVLTGWRLDALARTPAGRFHLEFTVGETARRVTADYVVLCVPFPVLRTLAYTRGPATDELTADEAHANADSPRVHADALRFLTRIEPVFPGLGERWNGKAASSLPHLDPNLLCSYSHWKVGQYQTIAGYEGV